MELWQLGLSFILALLLLNYLNSSSPPKRSKGYKKKSIVRNNNLVYSRKIVRTNKTRHLKPAVNKDSLAVRKGVVGEYVTNIQLHMLTAEYKHLSDLLLNVDGKTTQIDHVVIAPYGIFVIETKNYKGWIYGNEDYKYWTQTFNRNSKYKIPNPIWQNNYHIKAVKQNIGQFKKVKYYSIISFSKNAKLKAIPKSKNGSYNIVFDTDVADTIQSKRSERFLNMVEVGQVYSKLINANITDPVIRKNHVKRLER